MQSRIDYAITHRLCKHASITQSYTLLCNNFDDQVQDLVVDQLVNGSHESKSDLLDTMISSRNIQFVNKVTIIIHRHSFCKHSFCKNSFCKHSFCKHSFCKHSFCKPSFFFSYNSTIAISICNMLGHMYIN